MSNSIIKKIGGCDINHMNDIDSCINKNAYREAVIILTNPYMPKYTYSGQIITNQDIVANIISIESLNKTSVFELSKHNSYQEDII